MPNASVTANLVVRDQQFQSKLHRAVQTMNKVAARMQNVADRAKRMLLVGGAAAAVFVKLAADQQKAEAMMEAGLAGTGDSIEQWSAKLKKVASEIQKVTVHGDEFVLQQMASASALGVNADKLEETIKLAIGLAQVMGTDLTAAVRYAVMAQQGEFTMLQRYIPAIRKAQTETAKMAAILEAAARGWGMAEAEAKTFWGRLIQLKNSLGDVGEALGATLIPYISRAVDKLREVIPRIEAWIKVNGELIVKNAALIAGGLLLLAVLPRLLLTMGSVVTLMRAAAHAFRALTAAMLATAAIDWALVGSRIAGTVSLIGAAAVATKGALVALLANPVVALAAAVVALGAAVLYSVKRIRDAKKELEGVQQSSRDFAATWSQYRGAKADFGGAKSLEDRAAALKRIVELERELAEHAKTAGQAEVEKKWTEAAAEHEEQINRVTEAIARRDAAAQGASAKEQAAAEARRKAFEDEMARLELDLEMLGQAESVQRQLRWIAQGRTQEELAALEAIAQQVDARQELLDLDEQQRRKAEEAADEQQREAEQLVAEHDRLIESLKRQAMTQAEITAEKRAQIEAARQAGEITEKEYARLVDKLNVRREERQEVAFTAQLQGLQATYNRIATAAASRTAAGPQAAQADAMRNVAVAARDNVAETRGMKSYLKEISEKITRIGRELPLVGAFGD